MSFVSVFLLLSLSLSRAYILIFPHHVLSWFNVLLLLFSQSLSLLSFIICHADSSHIAFELRSCFFSLVIVCLVMVASKGSLVEVGKFLSSNSLYCIILVCVVLFARSSPGIVFLFLYQKTIRRHTYNIRYNCTVPW